MSQEKFSKQAFSFSVGLHVLLITLLIVTLTFHSSQNSISQIHIIQANVINSSTTKKHRRNKLQSIQKRNITRLKKEKQLKKQEQLCIKKRAEIKRKQHLKNIKKKKEQLLIKKQAIARKKHLAALKKEKKLAQKRHLEKSRQEKIRTQKQKTPTQHVFSKKLQAIQTAEENSLEKQLDSLQRSQSIINKYKALILNTIGQHWIMPRNIDKNLSTQLLIHLAPDGVVLNVEIVKSSGNGILDRSVVTAVWKSSPLPTPSDPNVFNQFRLFHLIVKPEGLIKHF